MSPRIGHSSTCALAAAVVACSGSDAPRADSAGGAPKQDAAAPAPAAARAPGGTWFEIARTPEIVAYMDTARLERPAAGVGRVWYRFEYATPMRLGDDTVTRYRAVESRLEVDCGREMAKGLEMRVETEAGVSSGSPTPEQQFQSVDEHPLGSGVFFPACRMLGKPLRPRSAR